MRFPLPLNLVLVYNLEIILESITGNSWFWQQESKFRTSQLRTKYRILPTTGAHMLTKVAGY